MRNYILVLFSLVVFNASALVAQGTAVFAPQPPNPPGFVTCQSHEDTLYMSEWNRRMVHMLCVADNGDVRHRELFDPRSAIVQIIPVDPYALYAYSDSGKLIHYDLFGATLGQWRVFGGGFIASIDSNSVKFRFPWDGEQVRTYLYDGGQQFVEPLPQEPSSNCSQIERMVPTGDEFCIDPRGWVLRLVKNRFGGPRWDLAKPFLIEDRPVNIAADGETLFVTLGNEWRGPEDVRLGKLVAVHATYEGNVRVDTVVEGLDVDPSLREVRLGASKRAVYYLSRGKLLRYDRKSKAVVVLPLSNEQGRPTHFSALAVAPSQIQ